MSKVFTKALSVSGDLWATFVFTSKRELDSFKKHELQELSKKYKITRVSIYKLDKLKIGDTCMVLGEGVEKFKIEALKQYAKYNYAFVLDSGWTEPVHKCYKLAR
jgi:hypothetical protein